MQVFQDNQMNRKFKRTAFIWNWLFHFWSILLLPCWIKVIISFKKFLLSPAFWTTWALHLKFSKVIWYLEINRLKFKSKFTDHLVTFNELLTCKRTIESDSWTLIHEQFFLRTSGNCFSEPVAGSSSQINITYIRSSYKGALFKSSLVTWV